MEGRDKVGNTRHCLHFFKNILPNFLGRRASKITNLVQNAPHENSQTEWARQERETPLTYFWRRKFSLGQR